MAHASDRFGSCKRDACTIARRARVARIAARIRRFQMNATRRSDRCEALLR
jgi:hypothetical protein